jgi:hypothetical protein
MQRIGVSALVATAAALLTACATTPSTGPMSFFVTSVGGGNGADLGGLAGADAHCQKLASAAGAGAKTWHAYLSVPGAFPSAGKPAVIASNLDHLHNGNHISKETALDERGSVVKGRGDNPNEHDMLTGSRHDGTAFAPLSDTTCKAWTSSNEGSAILGHHDRLAPLPDNWGKSWNSSHPSVGCSQEALIRTGGAGRFYCFAVD